MSAAPVRAPVRTLAVVVPAHDEAELLPACLDALAVSLAAARRARPDLVVAAVVVLDACRDASADVVARRTVPGGGLVGLAVAEANVGRARRAGVAHALERLGGADPARTWIASTDADSVVPPGWATHHLDLADDGADVVLGGVRPPLADLTPGRARAWLARHVPGVANGHVHGANLGVRADVYAAAGGYAPLVEHEDVGLVATARELGARVVATADAWVLTSARLVGRTPGGYARYLRDDLENVGA
ncbi:glycosyltransferase family 2 protein [Cellulomonas sp. PhB143]|uniref:glycosyltransferase n=1 Tax=Cellulomonas sp. PhB143 TaxID=2485186 RepID=UPI000FAEC5FD|nr:glycosyltransferase [Cellulomonas sp. PhB143]ROS78646.1 glycosyl transferase family 2 [Cellulomonas sp. PhB143]